jgi:hypothetical protein
VKLAAGLTLVLLAGACGKSSGQDSAPAPSTPPAATVSAPAPSTSASVAAATTAPTSMQGTYKTTAGTLVVTADWRKTHFAAPESSAGIGEGTMTVQVDGAGRVTGTLDGVLGAAVLEGKVSGDNLSAAIRRKDPTDRGFAGTLVGTAAAGGTTGTMNLASAEGGVVRTGTFTLSPGH